MAQLLSNFGADLTGLRQGASCAAREKTPFFLQPIRVCRHALAPTPAQAARLREATLARLLQEHRIRRLDAERVLGLLRQPAITVAEGVTEAAVLHLRSLVARLRLANREFHQAERKLDELCATLREKSAAAGSALSDAAILRLLPGVGPVTLATLLTEAAGPINRRDYAALRTLSGVAPVTKRSGKSCIV